MLTLLSMLQRNNSSNKSFLDEVAEMDETKRIESGYLVPDDEVETLRQFLIDVPRMDVVVDGRIWTDTEHPNELLDLLFKLLPHWSAVLAAEFCTQTALAPFFCAVKETLEPETHFVDGGRQTVKVNSKEKFMTVEKPFKVVDFDDHLNARVLFVVTLILEINLETGVVAHRFCRTSLVEKDWVYVQDLSQEDEDAFENGAGAEDIAASAMRMRNGI